ncbi:MAG: DUF2924 domain-containing protein [Bauldia sp.]|nr:DUF2924 domain-containing protein [Bauldia sp.]
MSDGVLERLAALKTIPIADLKGQWRTLFEKEPPPFNRRYLESRLAYRIQELAYGGLKPETVKYLEELGEQLSTGKRIVVGDPKPVTGTMLVRDWRGTEHRVTVREADFEFEGRPYKSLSAIARAITGTRWNGWTFFGLKRVKP